jgi:nucleotide-binding universal stress UspA family protein
MIKSILVCTDGSENGNTACEYAMQLAGQLDAKLTALHVLDSRMLEGPLMADISGWLGAQPFAAQLDQFRTLMESKGQAIIDAFNSLAEAKGVDAEGIVKTGHPAQVILEEEARAELVVLGQNGEHAEFSGDMMGSIVERVVRHSYKPCLVTPLHHAPVTKILAAYDGSAHSSRALHEAIELALALKAQLVILTVEDEFDGERARAVSEEGIKLARAHECPAANLVEEGDPEKIILTRAEELGCNLIVVGAYGHSRIREMILGSTTTSLLTETHLPLMLVR